ncbi:ABC transporter ATP-binding protein [Chelatococcus sp. SYSU_G07232]|uniref:ABC transporter ATP-binding protein n=1 Tax=Chelatococcus albus TaxID=3047466 RepID=A0ABT7ADH7_9HYPH|nr:ABC transporter ATP-binding protein [Chelatococcus sp. SYSU_G07232]MDJ1157057.1 ABC transporter ATP-binding protein [Chelatococcus sp. SYSU_G07232]
MVQHKGAGAARLELRGITKRFGSLTANDAVSFAVAPGEIHALLGENGAGKSTLVKGIYGLLQPDEGEILWDGQVVHPANPQEARRLGIGMVFQHFSLFEALTVVENIALGMERGTDRKALAGRIAEVSRAYGLPLDPHREVHALSVGERQRVEIVRCLLQSPKLLIMDEPTSVLTPQEADRLFETLRRLAREGCSILYISHKLQEIKALCSRATILRGGRVVGSCDPAVETARSMAQMMIGAELKSLARRKSKPRAEPRLTIDDLNLPADGPFGVALKGVSFEVGAGEIFGIAGVAGNGQNELTQALGGERQIWPGKAVRIDGRSVGHLNAERRRLVGLCGVPEERNGHAAVPDMSLAANALLSARNRTGLARGGIIRRQAAHGFAERVIREFGVKARGAEAAARSLSGGNLQKYVVGREVLQTPDILVVAQPTWGVDAGAAATIHQALFNLAQNGAAIVVISQDLEELLAITDRLAVMNEGRLSRALETTDATIEEIGLLMGGAHGAPVETTAQQGSIQNVA